MPTPKLASTSYTNCNVGYVERQTIFNNAQPPSMKGFQMTLIVGRTKKVQIRHNHIILAQVSQMARRMRTM